jgi:hypothetical protein
MVDQVMADMQNLSKPVTESSGLPKLTAPLGGNNQSFSEVTTTDKVNLTKYRESYLAEVG